jgi:hypothetical protein
MAMWPNFARLVVVYVHGATLVTGDDRILAWSGTLRRHDARQ